MAPISDKQFWATLLEPASEKGPEVELLRSRDVRKASASWDKAFKTDPLFTYLRAGVQESAIRNWFKRYNFVLTLLTWIRTRTVITVDGGSSVVVFATPSRGQMNWKQRLMEWLVGVLYRGFNMLANAEQRKRQVEVRSKLQAVIMDKIGEPGQNMVYLDLAYTSPETQGHGHVSTLIRRVTRAADALGERSWLNSSNLANSGFYNKHGYIKVGEITLGDDNPAWNRNPVVVQVMVREPQSTA